jgi:hypothetical protein
MLQITIPDNDLKEFGQMATLLAEIKGHKIETIHEWAIPCGSGTRLLIRMEGPPGMKVDTAGFEQAIRLLEVAKEGIVGWAGEPLIKQATAEE